MSVNLSINEIQNQIIEEFSIFDTWMDKYEYLIQLGKSLPEMNESDKIEENRIHGCQSSVWVKALFKDNLIILEADSNALITKGIIAVLVRILSNQKPEDIVKADLYFIEKTGLDKNLSQTRSNGLISMIKQIKYFALGYIVTP
jgi:cysteine desulfuration protein SufE